MRSDSIIKEDRRAQVLISPPGSNPAEYTQMNLGRGGRRGRVRGRRGGRQSSRMDVD